MSELDGKVFQYKMDINNLNSKAIGTILAHDFKEMTLPQYQEFDGRLVGVKRRKRYCLVVFKNEVIPAGVEHKVFGKGIGQTDHRFNDKTAETGAYEVKAGHTNMQLNGSFQQGDLTVIRAIEIPVVFPTCPPTGVTEGLVTNPLAITNKTNYAAENFVHYFPKAFEIEYFELGKSKIPAASLADFPMIEGGVVANAGANFGGIAQNGLIPRKAEAMNKVRVLAGDMAFHIMLRSLYAFDMASYGKEYGLPIVLHTTELESNTP